MYDSDPEASLEAGKGLAFLVDSFYIGRYVFEMSCCLDPRISWRVMQLGLQDRCQL